MFNVSKPLFDTLHASFFLLSYIHHIHHHVHSLTPIPEQYSFSTVSSVNIYISKHHGRSHSPYQAHQEPELHPQRPEVLRSRPPQVQHYPYSRRPLYHRRPASRRCRPRALQPLPPQAPRRHPTLLGEEDCYRPIRHGGCRGRPERYPIPRPGRHWNSPQTLNLDFDTGSSDLWVWSTHLPRHVQAEGTQTSHNIFNPTMSSTWKPSHGQAWQIQYGDGSIASGTVGTDIVSIGGSKYSNLLQRSDRIIGVIVQD